MLTLKEARIHYRDFTIVETEQLPNQPPRRRQYRAIDSGELLTPLGRVLPGVNPHHGLVIEVADKEAAKIALALELEPYFAEEAKKRQEASQLRGRDKEGNPVFGGGKSPTAEKQKSRTQPHSQKVEKVPSVEKAKSRDQAAAAVGVSGKLVSAAKAIKAAPPSQVVTC